jgi:hypothetical protein
VLIPALILVGVIASIPVDAALKNRIFSYNLIYSVALPLIICSNSFNAVKNVGGHPEVPFFRALMFVPIKLAFTYFYVGVLHMG